MRGLALVAFVLLGSAACACPHATQTGPSWPAPSTTAEDGGESLAPRQVSVASALEASEDEVEDSTAATAAESGTKPAAAESSAPAGASQPAAQPEGDVIMTDDLIIEIDD